jgi:hypothetical protein
MLILPQQKLGFIVLQETGQLKGHSIGGGWLAMPTNLPDINDLAAWSQFIILHPPQHGLFASCGGKVVQVTPVRSVQSTFLALHPVFKGHSPVPTLRVRLLNHTGESCLSIVLNDETLEVPSIVN